MVLSDVKDKIEELIKKFGANTEVSFSMYDDFVGECFDLTFHFDSADKENDKIIVNVNFDN